MVKKVCKYRLLAALLFTAGILGAQDLGWRLHRAGEDAVFTIGGERTRYSGDEFARILFQPKDMIQSGSGRAEIRLAEAEGTAVICGENTSLMIDSLDAVSLELVYGRILVRSTVPVTVRAGNSVTVLREGEAALDYLIAPGASPQPVLTVHGFSGGGELVPLQTQGQGRPQDAVRFSVNANESLSLEYRVPFSWVERRAVDAAAVSYWAVKGVPAVRAEPVKEDRVLPAENEIMVRKRKNGMTVMGFLLAGAGAVMQGSAYFGGMNAEARDRLMYGGIGVLGLGGVFLFGAAAYNP